MARKVALLLFIVLLIAGTSALAQGAVFNAPARQDGKMAPSITALEDTSSPETSLAPQATAAAGAPAGNSGNSTLFIVIGLAAVAIVCAGYVIFIRKPKAQQKQR